MIAEAMEIDQNGPAAAGEGQPCLIVQLECAGSGKHPLLMLDRSRRGFRHGWYANQKLRLDKGEAVSKNMNPLHFDGVVDRLPHGLIP
jgi:hypothetical protein